ncbi:MAG: hypothetical protein MZV70_24480 [Desulfobacterales bacterium]|nr:hypothetical protein [Desulfobacterales bacterium]
MSYVINDAYLFVGDTMSLKNGKADLFNEFFNHGFGNWKGIHKETSSPAKYKIYIYSPLRFYG